VYPGDLLTRSLNVLHGTVFLTPYHIWRFLIGNRDFMMFDHFLCMDTFAYTLSKSAEAFPLPEEYVINLLQSDTFCLWVTEIYHGDEREVQYNDWTPRLGQTETVMQWKSLTYQVIFPAQVLQAGRRDCHDDSIDCHRC